ncbi:short-chain dehydrogenase [Alicycliphilus denitrificans]|jgi:NAD(P)-dependent dehydrogenase (short-subunit alcohol dehydrogenase family)|uniref:SDR family oxidoreductase n=1 Tax=Alicycliphilus denitrificans TaxID=179636 RepID=UPI0019158944|nr:SDR family oxidoreductase [Alicycliphilus denitrificans]BCN37647.1 short-chain dehydrogenase [Alicycliphilus denitrificans]|tara:strand:+ start:358 stop:1086 length:729 start_codon:yes stop_codon:yes gene_type:complete
MNALRDKTVVVIGGSSGIGLRVAQLVADEGARLLIVGRDTGRLQAAQADLQARGATVGIHQADAHDHTALASLFDELPAFDHLVSMIGDVMGGGFIGADIAVIRHVIESKFFTNLRIGQLAATKVREGGSLVFTSGTGGRAQDACASYVGNLGINALVEGLAVELAPKARVNAVSPTWTVTPFWRDVPPAQVEATRAHFEQVIPLKRTARIDELASAYLFLMNNGFVTGQHIAVDGGIMLGA